MSRTLSLAAGGGLRSAVRAILALSLASSAVPALAQGIATDQQLDELVITAQKVGRKTTSVPATVVTLTAEDLRTQNLINPEDALKYVPNTTIRKRYIGDRNALIGGRSFAPTQPPRALVLMDGYLMSNFLARFDAPRWNMIAPEEMARVDVIYGPFSALHAGNSIGTTVVVRTRTPEKFGVGARATIFSETYEQYGESKTYGGGQVSAYLGNRFDNGTWFTLVANRQDATGHPMSFYTITAGTTGLFPTVTGTATPVTGVVFDTDPNGRRRAVFGPNSGAIDHTQQSTVKVRGGYDGEGWSADAFVGGWRNESQNRNATWLRDAAGNPVWTGKVSQDGMVFNIPGSAFAPFDRVENHLQAGLTLRTHRATGWNASVVASSYRILDDGQNTAGVNDAAALTSGGAGTLGLRDGTRWNTFEVQATWTPESATAPHRIALGYHRNGYRLANPTYNLASWTETGMLGSLAQDVAGRTQLQAVYLQDLWRLSDTLTLTSGLRYERWHALDGRQFFTGLAPLAYPERRVNGTSPKLSLAWQMDAVSKLRVSAGRGIRFPTVPELFQGSRLATSIQVSDPNLKPEVSDALELAYSREFSRADLRVSLFEDDVKDSIFSQTNVTVTPQVTNIQNVGRVRTRGIEAQLRWRPAAIDGLSIDANAALTKAEILENANFPAAEGKNWPRIPRVRANLQAVYAFNDQLTGTLAGRWSGRMYNTLDNIDINPDVYGGVSRAKSLDMRLAWQAEDGLELALGIDNLTNAPSYQAHPLQGRTVFAEVRWAGGER